MLANAGISIKKKKALFRVDVQTHMCHKKVDKIDDLKGSVAQKGKQQRCGDSGRLLQRGVTAACIPATRAGSSSLQGHGLRCLAHLFLPSA